MRFSLRHQQEVKWLWSIPKCIHSKRVLLSATSLFSTIPCDLHSDETAIEGNQADSAWMHLTSFDQPWHPLLNKCKSAIYNLLLPSCTQLLLLRDPSRKTSRGIFSWRPLWRRGATSEQLVAFHSYAPPSCHLALWPAQLRTARTEQLFSQLLHLLLHSQLISHSSSSLSLSIQMHSTASKIYHLTSFPCMLSHSATNPEWSLTRPPRHALTSCSCNQVQANALYPESNAPCLHAIFS